MELQEPSGPKSRRDALVLIVVTTELLVVILDARTATASVSLQESEPHEATNISDCPPTSWRPWWTPARCSTRGGLRLSNMPD